MKAKEGVLDLLYKVVTLELTAVHHYLLHASLCDNWGYERLHHEFHEHMTEETTHVSKVIGHVLYLGGRPDVQKLGAVSSGQSVQDLFNADLKLEQEDVTLLRDAIAHCAKVSDFTTRHLLEEMVVDSEEHVNWFETQLRTIAQVGLENYLGEQIKK
ncbi:MAG: bacterioferritin [Nitrospiraceae bacterium]|nr:MAG: bacterioferritin [Nitrospiraceae bacterium]RPH79662.1 MAG: bacterioferritin [Nitrospiraceae bacterium]